MRTLLAVALILLSSYCWGASEVGGTECEGPDSGSTRRKACVIAAEAKISDGLLNTRYQTLLKKYAESNRVKERRMLIDAQRSWVRFRDKTCEFENEGGGSDSVSWSECLLRVTDDRLRYINNLF
jgi:uncharacterized protein YecT (DUF1311 family)